MAQVRSFTLKAGKAIGAIVTIVALSVLAGCRERPDTVTHGDYKDVFETLPELVAASEVVVLGTVESAAKGNSIAKGGGPPYSRDLTVLVEKQYYGQTVSARIVVEQEGYDGDGGDRSYELMEQPWLYPGDRAAFFLETSELPPYDHFFIVTPGQFTLKEDGIVSISAQDPIARQLDGAPWSTVEREIEAAVALTEKKVLATPKETLSPTTLRSSPSPSPPSRDPNEQLVYRVIEFARSPSRKAFAAVPLATDGVWLGLGPRLVAKRSLEKLSKPRGWWLDVEYFKAGVGPFSALDLLADRREVRVSAGPHPHCASPQPVPPPRKFAELDRLSAQPRETGSCLQWWTVDFFVSADGTIQAVTLDFWEP